MASEGCTGEGPVPPYIGLGPTSGEGFLPPFGAEAGLPRRPEGLSLTLMGREAEGVEEPMPSRSAKARRPGEEGQPPWSGPARAGVRGVVAFDMDGTLLDSMPLIGRTAASILHETFGTPYPEAELQYYRTTGKPFELQLEELYPEATPYELQTTAKRFHEEKAKNAYAHARLFPEVPRVLKLLDRDGWKLVVSTGAEREMAEVVLEREGLGFLFEEVRGAQQGTKDAHLRAFGERWPGLPLILVGDSRFDMEAGGRVPGVAVLGRACHLDHWEVTPADLRRWGARWADYSLENLPHVLGELFPYGGSAPSDRPGAVPSPPPEGGARTYTGRRKCDVASCTHRASWRWQRTYLCDDHLREEARSARTRGDLLHATEEEPVPEPTGRAPSARRSSPRRR